MMMRKRKNGKMRKVVMKIKRNFEGDDVCVDSSNDEDDVEAHRDKLIIIMIALV